MFKNRAGQLWDTPGHDGEAEAVATHEPLILIAMGACSRQARFNGGAERGRV
jgi:hypothetical protein